MVVELGYRDQFDWKINGKVVHLGERASDDQVQSQIDRYVSVLGQDGRKIVLLSIPYTSPPPSSDGSPSPAASPARHRLINQMIQNAARGHSNVTVVDLDKKVSPAVTTRPRWTARSAGSTASTSACSAQSSFSPTC